MATILPTVEEMLHEVVETNGALQNIATGYVQGKDTVQKTEKEFIKPNCKLVHPSHAVAPPRVFAQLTPRAKCEFCCSQHEVLCPK